MRTSVNLLILGFLFVFIPMQTMAGGPGPLSFPYNCGQDYHNLTQGLCTGSVNGCAGRPVVVCTGGDCSGTNGNDCIIGTSGSDIIHSGKGNDVVCGFGGEDSVDAGYGVDIVCGGSGNDVISGGWGRDLLNGESGTDLVDGGKCDDRVVGGADPDDICQGGQGDDALEGSCEILAPGPTAPQTGVNCP